MDITVLARAHEDFLAVANEGGFGPPPPGEWDAERLLAHVGAADAAVASVALAVTGGERPVYDNRASLDEWNLRRIAAECGGLAGLAEFVRAQGQLLCRVGAALPESARSVQVPVLIVSGASLIVDEPWLLGDLVGASEPFTCQGTRSSSPACEHSQRDPRTRPEERKPP